VKEKLLGLRFHSTEEIITATREAIQDLLQISISSVSRSYTEVGRLA
jgi:hypothetical protein